MVILLVDSFGIFESFPLYEHEILKKVFTVIFVFAGL